MKTEWGPIEGKWRAELSKDEVKLEGDIEEIIQELMDSVASSFGVVPDWSELVKLEGFKQLRDMEIPDWDEF